MTIFTIGYEGVTMDEFIAALQKAGVTAHLIEETALPHGFADFAGVVPAARRAIDRLAGAITSALERG